MKYLNNITSDIKKFFKKKKLGVQIGKHKHFLFKSLLESIN